MTMAFRPGMGVLIDGRDRAEVCQSFPDGSSSNAFPHYKVDYVDGDRNVAVGASRVTAIAKLRQDWIDKARADGKQDMANAELILAKSTKTTPRQFMAERVVYLRQRWERSDQLLPQDVEVLVAAYCEGAGLSEV